MHDRICGLGAERGERFMRRFALSLGIVVAALALVALPAAVAANPGVVQFDFSGTFTDYNFCDTGETVEGSFSGHGTEFLSPNKAVDYWNTTVGNVSYTNPANDATVLLHFAGPFQVKIVSGDPETGTWVEETTNIGLPEHFRTQHGGVLTLDAGIIGFRNTFVDDESVSSEILFVKGPHPQAESDFELFCEVIPDALGLS
jgi:hypothetical protein